MALGAPLLLLVLLSAVRLPGAALGTELGGAAEMSGLRQRRLWEPAAGGAGTSPGWTHSDPPATPTQRRPPQPGSSDPSSPPPSGPRPPAPAWRRRAAETQPDWTDTDLPPDPRPLEASDWAPDLRASKPQTKPLSQSLPGTKTQSLPGILTQSEPNTESPIKPMETLSPSEPNPETQSPSEPNPETQSPSEPNPETQSPSEPNPETQSPSEPIPETQPPSEPNPETQSPSEVERRTRSPSERNTEAHFPSEPNTETQSPLELPAPAWRRKAAETEPDWTDLPPEPRPLEASDWAPDLRASKPKPQSSSLPSTKTKTQSLPGIQTQSEPNTQSLSEPMETQSPYEPNPETQSPSEVERRTRSPSEPTETQSPSEPKRRTRSPSEPKQRTSTPSEPNTETQSPSEPKRRTRSPSEPNTETQSSSKPKQRTRSPSEPDTETQFPSELNRRTRSPAEPNSETHSPSELNTDTQSPSEPKRRTRSPSEPNTETQSPFKSEGPEPNPETQSPSELNRRTTSPYEPNTETQSPSEPNIEAKSPSGPHFEILSSSQSNTKAQTPSEPQTKALSPTEPGTKSLSGWDIEALEPNDDPESPSGPKMATQTVPESERGTSYSPEPDRTSDPSLIPVPRLPLVQSDQSEVPRPFDLSRRRKVPVIEPYWTEAGPPPDPESQSPPGPFRWESGPSTLTGTEEARTLAVPAQVGHQTPYTWDITQTDGQTSSASGVTPKSVTRRHLSKRTPHTDTSDASTSFPQEVRGTASSIANGTGVSSITEEPTTYPNHLDHELWKPKDSGNTGLDSGDVTQVSVTVAKDSGNTSLNSGGITQISVTGAKDSGNTSLDSGGVTQVSVTEAKDSGNTGPDSGGVTQVSVTGAKDSGTITGDTVTRDSGNSTSRTEQTSAEVEPTTHNTYPLQTPSNRMTTYPTSPRVPESSSLFTSVPDTTPDFSGDLQATVVPLNKSTVVIPSNPSWSDSGLSMWTMTSPVTSSSFSDVTMLSNQSSSEISSSSPILSTLLASTSSTTSPTEASSTFPSSTNPPTTIPTTTMPPSLSSLPSLPPSLTTATETATYDRISTPTGTDYLPGGHKDSTTGIPETSSVDPVKGMSTTIQDLLTTTGSIPGMTSVGTSVDSRTQNITQMPHHTQPTSTIPTMTTNLPLIPSAPYSTPSSPQDVLETTRPQDPTVTTKNPDKPITTEITTTVDNETVTLRVETTASTPGARRPPEMPSPPTVVTIRYPTVTPGLPPTPATPTRTGLPAPAADPCAPNPCLNGGVCMERSRHKGYRCECPAAWQGRHCDSDVNECQSSPCPAQASCVNQPGSFFCHCPLGYIMDKGGSCVQVRTFLGHIEVPKSFLNGSRGIYTKLQQIEEEIVHILNSSFSPIGGYHQSSVLNSSFSSRITLSVQNLFLLSSNVTIQDLRQHIQRYAAMCQSASEPSPACRLFLHPKFSYIALSLCVGRNLGCDNETSECADPAGIAFCQCKPGYFKYSKMDHSCRACDDGYRLQEGTCVRCPFGLGGFNCSNPYQLITVIIAAAGGGLLLILGVTLAVTCCRKSKHDISKLIFKSGDFQMSPYAEYPKTQRSAEWGRETIEMQENGSTKNLLQMTDVYYNPGLRNSELERNGLYPYTGMPGSRHSCIYPGQYNPSFINEENRRRDYF